MKILLSFLIISYTYALELNDTLTKVSVIKHYKNNHLVLNRGLEDGIDKFDHIKLTNRNGYIARAVCTKVSMLLSHWKVYRVVNPELLSYDPTYTINSMKQSEMPPHIKQFLADLDEDAYSERKIKDSDLNKGVQLQQERIVNFDLANDMIDDQVFKANPTDTDKFLKRNFDTNKFTEDLKTTQFRVFASPFRTQSEDDEKSSNYGFNLYNSGSKYLYRLNYNKIEETTVNNFTKETVDTDETLLEGTFVINKITESTSYMTYYRYNQRSEGEVNYPKSHVQIGLLGFTFHISEEDKNNFFDISYVTLLDNYEAEINLPEPRTISENNVRHGIRIRWNSDITDNLKFASTLWYQPLMDTSKFEMDFEDNRTNLLTSLNYYMNKNFYLSYEFEYWNDVRRKREWDRDQINTINTVNFNYLLSL